MDISAFVSYKKVKAKYGVKTVKEVEEILNKINEEFGLYCSDDSFSLTLWNDEETRKIGRSYHIHMENKEENVAKAKEVFSEISENFRIIHDDMKFMRKMSEAVK